MRRTQTPVKDVGERATVSQPVLWMELQRSYAATDDGRQVPVEVVRVIGEVDLTTAGQLASALAELVARPAARIVVDATRMTFCGLRGLGALHDGARLAAAHGAGFAIVGLSGQLTRLSRELWPAPHPAVFPDRVGAVASLVAEPQPSRPRPARLLEHR
ncbi:STAS domain-containing protein [Actinomycetospora atypica]|uniref:STAS domain-containing protein n=1 Tax=Actinomycetospora atypica TaxID=1290095 RepID=A0ABV9YH01_9PSEU